LGPGWNEWLTTRGSASCPRNLEEVYSHGVEPDRRSPWRCTRAAHRRTGRFAASLLGVLCVAAVYSAEVRSDTAAPSAAMSVLSADEMRSVVALGPWPVAVPRDPGNRVSGNAKAIELGRQLFRDPRMSPVGYIACVTCHQPDRAFTDIKARAHGLADLPRNTPALANLSLQRWYGWGGGADSLWMASIKPILDAREFDGNAGLVRRLFVREPELAACYRSVFGVSPLRGDVQRTVVNVGKALAAFVETLVTTRTPFDDLRDAVARGDAAAAAAYPANALRGLKLFVGRAGCVSCHGGPNFSDGEFHPGVAPPGHAAAASPTDSGRLGDARALKASAFNLTGTANDDATRRKAPATRRLSVHEDLSGRYRTPSLRNAAVTAPYFHNGQTERLIDAVQHAQRLTAVEASDLAAFVATLTDAHGARRPWDSSGLNRCP
jgi:cytochrome c peroxidase